MTKSTESSEPLIGDVPPAETVGRDTIARYQAQFRAAAYACLQILNGKTVDRVYCDYQDDFVCRETQNGTPTYHFYQVKTKSQRNYQWGRSEIFGIPKKQKPKTDKVATSFAGKLMVHTVRFKSSCGSVIFLTNVHLDDDLEDVATAIKGGDFTNPLLKSFMEKFNDAFCGGSPLDEETIKGNIRKLLLKPGLQYLNPYDHDFEALARDAIFEYSEIDLHHMESEEIINNLVTLVEKKSFSKLMSEMTSADLDDTVGVGISDLLEILSISKGAYQELLAGGDPNAIKSASIIQRKLSQAGASENLIEYCSKWKVSWDVWLRDKRHTLPEFDLNFILDALNTIKNNWAVGVVKFADLQEPIDELWNKISAKQITGTLSKELLLGGVFSALVRSEAQ